MVIPRAVCERAATNYTVDENGCHISTYSLIGDGYAQIGWWNGGKKRSTRAHRAAWSLVHGPIPEGLTVDHMCKQRRCVNVEHLRLLSNIENARRNRGNDFPLGECPNGHELPLDQRQPQGYNRTACLTCHKESQRRYYFKRKAERV